MEEGGENGEADEEEVEVSFEVGGVRRSLRKGQREVIPCSFRLCSQSSALGPALCWVMLGTQP